MATLAACPAGSEIFTAVLSDAALPINNPIGIRPDGTLIVVPIYGKDYYQHEGYSTYHDVLLPAGLKLFSCTNSPEYYIDAGSSSSGIGSYKAFAIAWSVPAVGIRDAETSLQSPSVYPNPFGKGFYIANLKGFARIEGYDITGILMFQIETDGSGYIFLNNIPDGVYWLRITAHKEVTIQRIIKQ